MKSNDENQAFSIIIFLRNILDFFLENKVLIYKNEKYFSNIACN